MSQELGTWELRHGTRVLALLTGTYMNWPWIECSVVICGDASELEALFSFTERGRSGELEVFSAKWHEERLSLLARGYELHRASGTSSTFNTDVDLMLGLNRDGTGQFRALSTPNVRNCCHDRTG